MIKLTSLLKEIETRKILVPRRSGEERERNRIIALKRQIELNTKNGVYEGNLNLQNAGLTSLEFLGLGNINITGHFDCTHNKLTSLKGAPKSVGRTFYCAYNNLTSLEGAPESVGESFDCSNNHPYLTSLEGAPESVGANFDCENNKLTSLEGAPESVGGDFYCGSTKLTSLEGAPKSVGGSFFCDNNNLTSLKGAPKSVGESFDCSSQRNGVKFSEEDVRNVSDVKEDIAV